LGAGRDKGGRGERKSAIKKKRKRKGNREMLAGTHQTSPKETPLERSWGENKQTPLSYVVHFLSGRSSFSA